MELSSYCLNLFPGHSGPTPSRKTTQALSVNPTAQGKAQTGVVCRGEGVKLNESPPPQEKVCNLSLLGPALGQWPPPLPETHMEGSLLRMANGTGLAKAKSRSSEEGGCREEKPLLPHHQCLPPTAGSPLSTGSQWTCPTPFSGSSLRPQALRAAAPSHCRLHTPPLSTDPR